MKKKHGEEEAMDWYSWLSKSSSLDPSHVYEYGLAFTRNELKDEDLRYFNHEFLQSMGISVAKHRLEILKLARNKEAGGLSTFVNKTKKLLAKMVPHHQRKVNKLMMSPCQERGLMRRPCKPRLLKSGPLDRKVQVPIQEKMTITTRSSLSGPLDANKVQEKLMLPSCSPLGWGGKAVKERMMVFSTISPTKSGPLDATWTLMTMSPTTTHNNPRSLWSLMFQDMKPT